MNWAKVILLFRQLVDDTVGPPFKWPSDQVIEFAEAAQRDAARRSHLLVSARKAPSVADVVAGEPVVELDSRVIFIRRARLASQGMPLRIVTRKDMDAAYPGWERAAPSTPSVLIPDGETGAATLYPPPTVDDQLVMTVVHEPLDPITDPDAESPELPERYQRGLIYGMAELAFLRPDSETFNPAAAEKAAVRFEAEFGPKVSGLNERFSLENYYDVGDFQ